jgi:hypothetical protein
MVVVLYAVVGSAFRWLNWQLDVTCKSDAYIAPHDEALIAKFLK